VDDEIGPGEVEWLDLGPAERSEHSAAQRRNRRPWYLLAAALAGAVILVVALTHDTKRRTASPPSHPRPASATDTAGPSSAQPSPVRSPSVTVTDLGHRLLDVPVDWEVFARGPDSVVRIDLAKGRVTSTAVRELNDGSGVSFVVGPDRVMAKAFEDGSGYLVPDGHSARALPDAFRQSGPVLPGPDPNHVWLETGARDGTATAMTLVTFDGRPAGPSIRFPDGVGPAEPDGAGYVRFPATGGMYDARPGGVKRMTSGALLATGPRHWLAEECDSEFRCATKVTNRVTGAQRTLAASTGNYSFAGYSDGLIAPNGSVAALVRDDGQEGRLTLSLFDLSNGAFRETGVDLNPDQVFNGGGVIAWSPDSRWLFIAAEAGQLLVLDPKSMRARELSGAVPFISQVALRTG
jgi:hypothetical protein